MTTDDAITTLPEPEAKPTLVLMPGNASAEQLAELFQRLTGRNVTPE